MPTGTVASSRSLTRLALAPTLLALAGIPLMAEDKPAPAPAPKPAPAAEATPSDKLTVESDREGDFKSDTVHATKLGLDLQDTPQSITVINQDLLRATGAFSMRDALRSAPGVTVLAGEQGTTGDRLFIRGFSVDKDIFVDGLRDNGQYYRDTFNLQQVEVLKGPSGMLFGRGTTGGAINNITKQPTKVATGDASYTLGSYEFMRVQAGGGGEVVEDLVGVRADAFVSQGNSFRDTLTIDRWGFAPTVTIKPLHNFDITLQYMHQLDESSIDFGLPMLNGKPIDMPVDTYYGFEADNFQHMEVDQYSATLSYRFNEHFVLRNATRYSDYWRTHRTERINSFPTPTTGRRSQTLHGFDQDSIINQTELSFTGKALERDLKLVAGFEYSFDKVFNRTKNSTASNAIWDIDLFNPQSATSVGAGRADDFSGTLNSHNRTTVETLSAYVIGSWEFVDTLTAVLGARFDTYDAKMYNHLTDAEFRNDGDMINPSVGLVWEPLKELSIYASYGTSYNPSAEAYSLSAETESLDPEETRSFEIGAKADLLEEALSVSIALFRVEKDNARTPDPTLSGATLLDGELRNDGIEIGAMGRLTKWWTIFGGVVFQDPEILNGGATTGTPPSAYTSYDGNQIQNTPKYTGNLWTSFDLGWGFNLGAGAYFAGKRYANDANTAEVPDYVRFDAALGYTNRNWYAQLNVFNLTDEEYYEAAHSLFVIPGAPLSGQVTVGLTF